MSAKDINITQSAELKVLMPILQEALAGGNGALNLNMVGPIYIGPTGIEPGSDRKHSRTRAADQKRLSQPQYISNDDLFAEDIPLSDFIPKARILYFRIVASRHNFEIAKISKALSISTSRVCQIAREAGVKVGNAKKA